jgi:hypothetical protein
MTDTTSGVPYVVNSEEVNPELRELMLGFESLGGHGAACEFGLLQRYYGAEPLGLLRWANITPHSLVRAIEIGFSGIGDQVSLTITFNTELRRHGEYIMTDDQYKFSVHTWMFESEIERSVALELIRNRTRFLARELIEDLREAQKIFVYRMLERDITDAEANLLQTAMQTHGDATLLCARYSSALHPPGTVERLGKNLLIGYIDHYIFLPERREFAPLSIDCWTDVCRAAKAMVG